MIRKTWMAAVLAALACGAAQAAEVANPAGVTQAGLPGAAPLLPQAGNPIRTELGQYRRWLSKSSDSAAALAADRALADNIVSWQMPHGGFYKLPAKYAARWDGSAARSGWIGNGVELGTIDNDATVSEILVLADVYARTRNPAYRDSARRAMDFLLAMQHPSGSFPQVYPTRGPTSYSNHATFNDNAMIRALLLLDQAARREEPLTAGLFTEQQQARFQPSLARAVDFILKAQIVQDGVKTVWCAQHDAVSYAPVTGRSFELPSKSGAESAVITEFLMTRPQTPEVAAAVKAALAWYRRPSVQLKDVAFDPGATRAANANPFVPSPGTITWYRFYDLAADTGFFSGRLPTDNPPGVGKQYDIMKVGAESRYTYQWGGSYGTPLLAYAAKVGY
ncbi:pectate lyase [Massilia yuzhufengensis]|uniref:Pectate lyase, PelA/Pel-15E family n=1 Tax=Massilia yuzhufengensis TaxID=1164594 RepID=A0A1I1MZS2_9BURK|nr:pectate lyase [Massilia yuzhufengensis]SFC90392.1 pectate lyase, PelA/Pel-15E family [Massilia yuzhufengensis]